MPKESATDRKEATSARRIASGCTGRLLRAYPAEIPLSKQRKVNLITWDIIPSKAYLALLVLTRYNRAN